MKQYRCPNCGCEDESKSNVITNALSIAKYQVCGECYKMFPYDDFYTEVKEEKVDYQSGCQSMVDEKGEPKWYRFFEHRYGLFPPDVTKCPECGSEKETVPINKDKGIYGCTECGHQADLEEFWRVKMREVYSHKATEPMTVEVALDRVAKGLGGMTEYAVLKNEIERLTSELVEEKECGRMLEADGQEAEYYARLLWGKCPVEVQQELAGEISEWVKWVDKKVVVDEQ